MTWLKYDSIQQKKPAVSLSRVYSCNYLIRFGISATCLSPISSKNSGHKGIKMVGIIGCLVDRCKLVFCRLKKTKPGRSGHFNIL